MSCYQHLTTQERESILFLLGQKQSVRQIAASLHRSPSTISRELQRNKDRSALLQYSPSSADRQYQKTPYRSAQARSTGAFTSVYFPEVTAFFCAPGRITSPESTSEQGRSGSRARSANGPKKQTRGWRLDIGKAIRCAEQKARGFWPRIQTGSHGTRWRFCCGTQPAQRL